MLRTLRLDLIFRWQLLGRDGRGRKRRARCSASRRAPSGLARAQDSARLDVYLAVRVIDSQLLRAAGEDPKVDVLHINRCRRSADAAARIVRKKVGRTDGALPDGRAAGDRNARRFLLRHVRSAVSYGQCAGKSSIRDIGRRRSAA